MSRIYRVPKVQIVSRTVPTENIVGHYTYLMDLMRYLRRAGCTLELVTLDPLFEDTTIPDVIQEIADVSIRNLPQLKHDITDDVGFFSRCKVLLRPYYMRLPEELLHAARKIWYWLRTKEMYEAKKWDALLTHEEQEFVRVRARIFQPDVVIVNYVFLSEVLDLPVDQKNVLKVILTLDIRYQRVENYKKAGYHTADADWTWEKESVLLQKADVLIAIQKDDAKTLREMAPQCQVICVPQPAKYHPSIERQVPGRCLFVGSDVDHNIYGLQWFLQQVWPAVIQHFPECSLHVCGTVCEQFSKEFPHVTFLGRVDNLASEYGMAEACVIPLVVGSGLKIKLVEALSHSRACVSTSVGIQGMQELTNKAILVADTAKEFAEAVVTILDNLEKRKKMEVQARKYVEEELSPGKVYQPFVDRIFQHVLQYKPIEEKK